MANFFALPLPESAQKGIWLVVHFQVRNDQLTSAEALFDEHVANGRSDSGNLFFTLLRHPEDPTRFTTLEIWTDQAAIDAHDATAHHAAFLRRLKTIQAEEKDVRQYNWMK